MSEEGDLTADQLARIANISVILAMERYVRIYCIYITLPGQPGDIWGVINLIFHT